MKYYGGSTAYYGVANSVSYFQGAGFSALVPDTYTVSINGRPYMLDLSQPFYRQYHRQVAPLIRTQADVGKEPGEQSMDPNGLWRRSFDDWLMGAGQRYLDRDTSLRNGFWQSKGIDALSDRWQIKLLPDTTEVQAAAYTNLSCVVANGYLYIAYNQTLARSTTQNEANAFTTITGTPGASVTSLCTDGNTVYAAYGASGIYSTVAGTGSASQYTTSAIGTSAVIGFVNGRLMLGNSGSGGDGNLYNIVASGTLPTALFTSASGANTTWVGFAEGNSFLYAAAQVGMNSIIYGCTVTTDGTALTPPSVQGKLPPGEGITAIFGYLGNLMIGSNLGLRFANPSSAGINIGSLISGQTSDTAYGPTSAVQCFAGYGRWVFFGWTNYDGLSTGMGRIDLENFVIENDLPAFASDVMYTGQGAVVCAAVVGGIEVFGVSGTGFVSTQGTLNVPTARVASGTLTSGLILYDLADQKIASILDVQTAAPLVNATVDVAIAANGGTFTSYAHITSTSSLPFSFALPGLSGQMFEVQLTLNRTSAGTATPRLNRWTLRSYPAPIRPITWQLPLILDEVITNRSGASQGFDPLVELQALESMASSGRPVTYQEDHQSYTVFVQDVEFLPDALTEDHHYFNGIALVTLQGLPVPGV